MAPVALAAAGRQTDLLRTSASLDAELLLSNDDVMCTADSQQGAVVAPIRLCFPTTLSLRIVSFYADVSHRGAGSSDVAGAIAPHGMRSFWICLLAQTPGDIRRFFFEFSRVCHGSVVDRPPMMSALHMYEKLTVSRQRRLPIGSGHLMT